MSKAVFAEFGCPKCGGDVYDNRENKRNPRAPDYKCKACEWVQWPEKKGEFQKAKSVMAEDAHADKNGRAVRHEAQPAARPDSKDDYWSRKLQVDIERLDHDRSKSPEIRRMHSQAMSLEILKLKVALNELTVEDLTPSKISKLADYFDEDVLSSATKSNTHHEQEGK